MLSYQQPGLVLKQGGGGASDQQVRDLQRDLRRLGYLPRGIDGAFGGQTALAVKGLQYDLLHNTGAGTDGAAPVKLTDFNQGRVTAISGAVDQNLVACLADLFADGQVPSLPSAQNPRQQNQQIAAQIAAMPPSVVPIPFLRAIFTRESNLQHFNVPGPGDEDTFITVGLDRNVKNQPHIITSRGYGVGQYTLFHHPPQPAEVNDFMLDVGKNLQKAITELKGKFDRFVNGPADTADDRIAEFGHGALRACKYASTDGRFMTDCKQCLLDAGSQDIEKGVTPFFAGSTGVFTSTQYYDMDRDADVYRAVPVRAKIGCDWPYAVRRYNGSGINSYHYQVRVLKHLLAL